jgi:hypothetical protein
MTWSRTGQRCHCHPLRDDIELPEVAILDQQNPLGVRMSRPAAGQQLRTRHRLHRLTANNQDDLFAAASRRAPSRSSAAGGEDSPTTQ